MPDSVELRMRKARISLALGHPYLATAVMRLPLRAAGPVSAVPTMATDGYHIFYNAEWVSTLPDLQVRGVIAHEVLHVVFGHPDRAQGRHPLRWNAACDHAVNLLLRMDGLELPKGCLADSSFAGLTAEEIYDALGKDPGSESTGNASEAGDGGFDLGELGQDILDPSDIRVSGLRDQDAPDAEGRRMLRGGLSREMKSHLHGTLAGFYTHELELADSRVLDWVRLLRLHLTSTIGSDWMTFPFSKKHIHRGLFLPSCRVLAPEHLVFAIDTSASMSNPELAKIFSEIRSLRESFPSRLTVVQTDAEVQSVEEFDAFDPAGIPDVVTVHGRGGTDFRPAFDYVRNELGGSSPIVIYATDGFGTFPAPAPAVTTIWVLTADAIADAHVPFGQCVRLPRSR